MKASVLIAHATSVLQAKKKREAEKRLADKDAASINDVPEKAAIFNDVSETLRIANAIRQRLPDNSNRAASVLAPCGSNDSAPNVCLCYFRRSKFNIESVERCRFWSSECVVCGPFQRWYVLV
jgi:hypothetical protein